jgi:hypothetical protein
MHRCIKSADSADNNSAWEETGWYHIRTHEVWNYGVHPNNGQAQANKIYVLEGHVIVTNNWELKIEKGTIVMEKFAPGTRIPDPGFPGSGRGEYQTYYDLGVYTGWL